MTKNITRTITAIFGLCENGRKRAKKAICDRKFYHISQKTSHNVLPGKWGYLDVFVILFIILL
nr:MAG TPA: hypothetical protein [Caudoviricetes sp.]